MPATDELQGRVAVITGGANGIGAATVRKLLAAGANVVIGDMNVELGESLAADLATDLAADSAGQGSGERVIFQATDVSNEADVKVLMDVAQQRFGRLDIVFNNAGIGGAIGPLLETEVEHWDHTFAVMVRGVFLGIKHGARAMRAGGRGGSIINTASIAALSGCGGPLAYSATKAAVVNITLNAAVELAELDIRVNAVCPGIIFTDLMHRGRAEEAEQVIRKIQPAKMRGEPEHIAAMVKFLASDESAFVTGTTQVVDGGYLAKGGLGTHPLPGVDMQPQYVGINHGTTGKGNEVRFLEPEQGSS